MRNANKEGDTDQGAECGAGRVDSEWEQEYGIRKEELRTMFSGRTDGCYRHGQNLVRLVNQ